MVSAVCDEQQFSDDWLCKWECRGRMTVQPADYATGLADTQSKCQLIA